ncbi:cobalt-precorrin-5B (C(1))-methyltransferase CbiD [Clostridium sp. B9]|uniref:cobalt-precorrin-5B (C(1))-methyltransferase CbiD n=1 Tax=Clostridium sp. B9 TaxID=3423224 RepID=UPI003D2F05D2
MFEMYIESGGKKLRCGYTTGSCATGAAKAATYMLFSKNDITSIEIDTPKNIKLNLEINNIKRESNSVSCSIIKDGGDDIDATSGMSIFAKAEEIDEGFELLGGEGIGVVTKDGLFVEKGEAAINPVPREMIKKEVLNVLPKGKGVRITISAPEGKEIAKKTFNPRLGIEGGISILGTTGIVYPMSEDAIKESIRLEIRQKSKNNKELLFVFGNMGERFIREYGYEKDNIVVISNYVGFSIECAIAQGVKDITIVGHIGKLSKIAFGCFNTHSRVSDVRLEVIALELTLMGYDLSLIEKVLREKTSEGAVKLLGDDFTELYERIGKKILKRLDIYSYGEVHFDILMYYGAKEMKLLYKSSN